jgi:hypothetical protein
MIDWVVFFCVLGEIPKQARKQTNEKNPSSCGQRKERKKQKEAKEREEERPNT